MFVIKSCCGYFSLKTGSKITAMASLVFCVIMTAVYIGLLTGIGTNNDIVKKSKLVEENSTASVKSRITREIVVEVENPSLVTSSSVALPNEVISSKNKPSAAPLESTHKGSADSDIQDENEETSTLGRTDDDIKEKNGETSTVGSPGRKIIVENSNEESAHRTTKFENEENSTERSADRAMEVDNEESSSVGIIDLEIEVDNEETSTAEGIADRKIGVENEETVTMRSADHVTKIVDEETPEKSANSSIKPTNEKISEDDGFEDSSPPHSEISSSTVGPDHMEKLWFNIAGINVYLAGIIASYLLLTGIKEGKGSLITSWLVWEGILLILNVVELVRSVQHGEAIGALYFVIIAIGIYLWITVASHRHAVEVDARLLGYCKQGRAGDAYHGVSTCSMDENNGV